MTKRLIPLLILLCLLGSCAPTPAAPTSTPTATISPTRTPRPTQTSIPTATPYPPLQTEGPYLLFTYDNKNFTIMDADGSGRRQFQLPNDGYISVLQYSVSPDKKWLAYFTGSIKEPYDVALNLLNLSEDTSHLISNLLASNFPENLEPIIDAMVLGDPPVYDSNCFESPDCRKSLVQRELVNSIYSFSWSPDSQFIAFTAQIDEPSSDIYIYSVEDATIRQLTHESENIYWMDWAPNGKKILFEISSTPGGGYEGRTLHITDLEGKTIFVDNENLYYEHWGESGWLTDALYLFDHPNDTGKPPIYNLMIVNTDTGQLKEIWPYSLDTYAVNTETKTIVLMHRNHRTQNPTVPEGVYMVYPRGEYKKISDIGILFNLMEGQKPYPIFAQDYNGQIYSISNNGSINALPWANDRVPWISPDGKWLLFPEDNEIALYTEAYQPIKSWSIDVPGVIWRPDSLGLFMFTNKYLYYLSIPNGDPVVVDTYPQEDCSVQYCRFQYVWLP